MKGNNNNDIKTNTSEVVVNLDEWFGTPGVEDILVPETQVDDKSKTQDPKPNVLNGGSNMDFLDPKEGKDDDEDGEKNKTPEGNNPSTTIDEIINEDGDGTENGENKNKPGRPKTDKNGLVEFFKEQIESKEMFTFDDFDETKQTLDEYLNSLSEKDLKELYKENIKYIKDEVAEKTPQEFFESLPQELQFAAKYVANGGTDLKGLFQALAHVEQTRELDPNKDTDQVHIVRQYLSATGFGTDEEIEEEISTWKDLNLLSKKANQFKPKLDKMQEEIVAETVAKQEAAKKQQEEASKKYVDNVFEALRTGEINGLKLEKTTQAKLYAGLTQAQYKSVSGRQTNLLGHLLEKYQFVEPNYQLLSEALWLLSDPEDYRKNLTKNAKNDVVANTVRTLKTEQGRKTATSTPEEDNSRKSSGKIPRPNTNFFKR
jgi:hypothetical protein